jgi:hypothetical protein
VRVGDRRTSCGTLNGRPGPVPDAGPIGVPSVRVLTTVRLVMLIHSSFALNSQLATA